MAIPINQIIPCDYDSIFKNRVLVLTGVGRSGTTILGKILGSMAPAYYLFEPAIMKYMAGLPTVFADRFKAVLFEDYFLPIIQGRGNMNELDWSFALNQMTYNGIMKRRKTLRRRSDAMKFIEQEKPWFIIKNPEFQPTMNIFRHFMPNVKYIHIIKNGLDVVSSSMERGWYTDEYMNTAIIDVVEPHEKCNIPFYLEEESKNPWPYWNPETRTACVWRTLTEQGCRFAQENPEKCLEIYYEDFCKRPEEFVLQFESLYLLRTTSLSKQHVTDVLHYRETGFNSIDIELIKEPERSKFMELMNKLNYKV